MTRNDYVAELRKRFSKDEKDIFEKGNDSVMLILRNECSEMKFGFACSRQTDFSEENLRKDIKIFEHIQKCISNLDMELCDLETDLSISDLA